MFPFRISANQIGLILIIILILFVLGKLPIVATALGKTVKSFRTGQASDYDTDYHDKEKDKEPRNKPKRLS